MGNEKHAYFHKSWGGEIKGRKIKLLKHVFALYSLPILYIVYLIIFLKNFLARSIAFYNPLINASMQCALPTPFKLVSLSLTASFQNSLKTGTKLHKVPHKMSKNCLRGEGGRRGGGET